MSDDDPGQAGDPIPEEPDDAEELIQLAVDDGKGGKNVPLSALVTSKKHARELAKKVKEYEAQAGRQQALEDRLNAAEPIVRAVLADPKLRAQALRLAKGEPELVAADDDPEAREHAEDMGFYLVDGVTPDGPRARRVLNRQATASKRDLEAALRPLAGTVLSGKAEQHLHEIIAETDEEGTPMATEQSIRDVVAALGADGMRLLADPKVKDIVLNTAIGYDRRNKRTPTAPDEPLRLATAGAGRGRRSEPSLSSEERARLDRLGLTEADYSAAGTKLASGRTMSLGKD